MSFTLKQAAERLSLTRPKLIKAMKAEDLLRPDNLPKHPDRDKLYLHSKEGQWFHPKLGMQYSRSTRVTSAGLRWLAGKLGIEQALPEPVADPRDVA